MSHTIALVSESCKHKSYDEISEQHGSEENLRAAIETPQQHKLTMMYDPLAEGKPVSSTEHGTPADTGADHADERSNDEDADMQEEPS